MRRLRWARTLRPQRFAPRWPRLSRQPMNPTPEANGWNSSKVVGPLGTSDGGKLLFLMALRLAVALFEAVSLLTISEGHERV